MWEDLGGLALLALIYSVAALVRKGQAANRKKRPPAPRLPVEQKPHVGTQAEGVRLEELLRSMDQLLGGNVKAPVPVPVPAAEPEIGVKDYDSGAEAVALRRRSEAETRNAAWTLADHAAFDRRIRTAVPAVAISRGPSVQQLREAFIWKEILEPPVSMR
ncbi:MAG: hypothetical protein ACREL6_09190 [Gemmatimonadales bacterium]